MKDRPCATILAMDAADRGKTVFVLPVTHSPPPQPEDAMELPPATKARLGLDGERSWIVVSEGDSFVWPGPDLRPAPGHGPETAAYGMLPPGLFKQLKTLFLERVRAHRAGVVRRTE